MTYHLYSTMIRVIEGYMKQKNNYNLEDLISCAKGEMFGEGNPQLPMPPMLMFDRITNITEDGGDIGKGVVIAELRQLPETCRQLPGSCR